MTHLSKSNDPRVARALLLAGATFQAIGLGSTALRGNSEAPASARLFLSAGAAAILILAVYERDATLFVGQLAAFILALRFMGKSSRNPSDDSGR